VRHKIASQYSHIAQYAPPIPAPTSRISLPYHSLRPPTPTTAHTIKPYASMSRMQLRTNRTTNNPGLVDLPNKRRSASDVAAETSKKREAAAAKASKKREQEARVASLEKEIKTAQREALRARVKKTFPAPQIDEDEVEEVRLCYPMYGLVPAIHLTLFRPPVPLSPQPASRTRGTGRRGRRQRWSQSTVGALSRRRRLPGVSRTTIPIHRSNPITDRQDQPPLRLTHRHRHGDNGQTPGPGQSKT